MTITYTMRNGVQYPNLTMPAQTERTLGRYAMLRLDYLKAHRKGTYSRMLGNGTLTEHLWETEQTAKAQISESISRMAQSLGVTEQMKQTDPMKWVGMMNNLKQAAEEEVLTTLIYR